MILLILETNIRKLINKIKQLLIHNKLFPHDYSCGIVNESCNSLNMHTSWF